MVSLSLSMRVFLLLTSFCLLAGCAKNQTGTQQHARLIEVRSAIPLAAFDLQLKDRTAERQVDTLVTRGYAGIVLTFPAPLQIQRINRIAAQQNDFKLTAIVWQMDLDKPVDEAYLSKVLPMLSKGKCLLLVSFLPREWKADSPLSSDAITKIRKVAEMAANNGVQMVLYPHEISPLVSADQAMEWKKRIARDDVMIALNLCHEMKAGNRDRLKEIIKRLMPQLAAVTINGADKVVDKPGVWDHTIQELGSGSYDVHDLFLKPLIDGGYKGPFILHTFGLKGSPETHLAHSMATWRSWVGTKS